MQLFSSILCLLAISSLTGCVISPGVTKRTPTVVGRGLDSRTSAPVAQATVALHDAPSLRYTQTDASGRFLLPKSSNFHFFELIGFCAGGPLDVLDDLSPDIDISHPDYSSARINPRIHVLGRDINSGDSILIKDIRLKRLR